MIKMSLTFEEEREHIYRILKDAFDFLASIMADEGAGVVQRIRAVKVLSETAKTMRRYLLDAENACMQTSW